MIKSDELSILVYSCIKNKDMWERNGIFTTLFRKYWRNCAYKVVLVTDDCPIEQRESDVFDKIIVYNGNWYEMIFKGMEVTNTPYVMLWMDDYLLCDYVQNREIEKQLNILKKYHAANLRFAESPIAKSKPFHGNAAVEYFIPGTAYSISTQVGIWDVKFLKANIKKQWTPWDFERIGSMKIKDKEHPLLLSKEYVFPYEEGIRRGKWMDNGIRLCRRNGIALDFTKRKPMSSMELAWSYFKGGLLEWNPNLIVRMQNFGIKR